MKAFRRIESRLEADNAIDRLQSCAHSAPFPSNKLFGDTFPRKKLGNSVGARVASTRLQWKCFVLDPIQCKRHTRVNLHMYTLYSVYRIRYVNTMRQET